MFVIMSLEWYSKIKIIKNVFQWKTETHGRAWSYVFKRTSHVEIAGENWCQTIGRIAYESQSIICIWQFQWNLNEILGV